MMQATTKGRSGLVLTAIAWVLPVTLALASSCGGLAQAPPHPVVFHVRLATSLPAPLSGRLLIFFKQGKGDKEVDAEEFHPEAVSVTAREVRDLAPGGTVDVDADELAFPGSFSTLPAGDYEVQAALDVEHTYNYSGRAPTDWISPVTEIAHWSPGAATPVLTLDHHALPDPAHAAALSKAHEAVAPGSVERVEMESALLSRFWGHPVDGACMGDAAAALCGIRDRALSDRLLDARLWRRDGVRAAKRGSSARPYGLRQTATHDLGDA